MSATAALRASLCALLIAALAGCESAAYVEPSGADTASLRIENQGPAIFGYELEADTYADPAACRDRLRLAGRRDLPRGAARSVHVAANNDFTLTLRGTGGGASRGDSCTLAATFRPSPGELYVAVFRAERRRCELLLVRQQSAPGGGRRYVDERSYRPRYEPACLASASAPSSVRAPEAAPPPLPASVGPPAPR